MNFTDVLVFMKIVDEETVQPINAVGINGLPTVKIFGEIIQSMKEQNIELYDENNTIFEVYSIEEYQEIFGKLEM